MAVLSPTPSFLLVYGPQSGQSKTVADQIREKSAKVGLHANINCLSAYGQEFTFESESVAVIVISSSGDNALPEAMRNFYTALHCDTSSASCFGNLNYTLLGLGEPDSTSCWHRPKAIDTRLHELGAKQFYLSSNVDNASGFEKALGSWIDGMLVVLSLFLRTLGSEVTASGSPQTKQQHEDTSDRSLLLQAKTTLPTLAVTSTLLHQNFYNISDDNAGFNRNNTMSAEREPSKTTGIADAASAPVSSTRAGAVSSGPADGASVSASDGHAREASLIRGLRYFGKKLTLPSKPCRFLNVTVVESQQNVTDDEVWHSKAKTIDPDVRCTSVLRTDVVTGPGAVKKTLLLELSLADTGLTYEPGDAVGIHCKNDEREVEWMLARFKVSKDEAERPVSITYMPLGSRKKPTRVPEHLVPSASLRQLFTYCIEIRAVPKKAFICLAADYTSDEHEKQRLLELCSREGSEDYASIVMAGRISILDILSYFPSCQPPVEVVLENLPPLQLRSYTAACSQLKQRSSVSILFNIMHLRSFEGQSRTGLCTGWLNQLTAELQTQKVKPCILPKVLLYPQVKGFRLPDDIKVPVLMTCIGTGVAPFVGFLEHRYHQKMADPNVLLGELWLFYGCRHSEKDFLFRDMLVKMVHRGVLTKFVVCFSQQNLGQYPRALDSAQLCSTDLNQATVLQSCCDSGPNVLCGEQAQATGYCKPLLGSEFVTECDVAGPLQAKIDVQSGYVQDALAMESRAVGELIWTKGAHVYVCGSSAMANAVLSALTAATATVMDVPAPEASAMITQLRISKRYFECGRVAIS